MYQNKAINKAIYGLIYGLIVVHLEVWYMGHGMWGMGHDTSTWYMVQVHGTWYRYMVHGTGTWNWYGGKQKGYWEMLEVAEIGGWLLKYNTIASMDKALDSDPTANHSFLRQRDVLLEKKIADPKARITAASNPFDSMDTVEVSEDRRQGLQGPAKSFWELSVYEKAFGKAPPEKIKVQYHNGVAVTGVDVIAEQDRFVDKNGFYHIFLHVCFDNIMTLVW